ncbi:MAG: cell division protein FtsN, partial [Syntrophomonadaceae bacterium]|nr:cell division protein FtsN [Syntrophomonadaceae bacterium]
MKSRVLIAVLVVALAAAVIGGGTMAWFTDDGVGDPVTFSAGTLMIDIDNPELTGTYDVLLDRLNPGDCVEWEFDVRNVGN